jgi:putative ABC transport system permease protein
MSPRWRKVASDLWVNKTRTVLVVLSIAVGVFAIGMITASRAILTRGLATDYAASRPSSATIYTSDPFDDDLVNAARQTREVREAEGRHSLTIRVRTGPDEWRQLQLFALADYSDVRVNKVTVDRGAWPPPNREFLVERSSVPFLKAPVGDRVTVKLRDGKEREMRIAGVAHDINQYATPFIGIAYGYVTADTAAWLREPRGFNELYIVTTGDPRDKANVERVTKRVQDKVEGTGRGVWRVWIQAGKFWADDSMQALILLLGVLGFFSLLLSGFLVANTISSLLTQQVRQVGVMKAIGARGPQIMAMYLATVLAYGIAALLVAVPLGALGARALSGFTANFLNFSIHDYGVPPQTLTLEIAAGLFIPMIAAAFPVLAGTRMTVHRALSSYGLGAQGFGRGRLDRLVEQVRGLSRPVLLSLRNTFRRKGRLGLTLATLTVAGAIFMGVFTVRASLIGTIGAVFDQWGSDVWVLLEHPYRVDRLQHEARKVPGVAGTEGWRLASARRVRPDGTESSNVLVYAPPAGTTLFHPEILRGRWLLPEDENAIVVTTDVLENEPDVRVGDSMVLKVAGRKRGLRVVGVARTLLTREEPSVYVNYPSFAYLAGGANRADYMMIITERHDAAFQSAVSRSLDNYFGHIGLRIRWTFPMGERRAQINAAFNVIVGLLLVMAVLLAIVGGLGLAGTMSINVLERTREIGVMRAIGASNGVVMRIVLVEGLLIGVISWALAVVLAVPLSLALSNAVGMAFLRTSLRYTFSSGGVLIWLGLVIALAGVASFIPAWNASRVTVRDVLSYE